MNFVSDLLARFGLAGGMQFTPEKDIPDLEGKVFLVTGANTGLGKETVFQLAKHSPENVYLAARTPSKADAAIADIQKAVPNASVRFLPLDLQSFASIKSAAQDFQNQESRLHCLINNAGIMATPPGYTKDGYEIQFGTNHMGHALLTKLLLPTLLKTAEQPGADVRIVNLSSMGYLAAPRSGIIFDQEELDRSFTWWRYGQSKLANVLFTRELARRYPQVKSVAVHPGVIRTDLFEPVRESNLFSKIGLGATGWLWMQSVPQGARNQLWAATAPADAITSGGFYIPVGKWHNGNKFIEDKALAAKLWDWTEEELKKHGY